MVATLGYWNIRGLAQPIRLLLEYCGEEYDEKLYNFGPAPDYLNSDWIPDKFKLGLDFPNLPYYIDGETKITQANAIMYYLGRKYNLLGSTEEEKVRNDILIAQITEFQQTFYSFAYNNFNNPLAKKIYISKTMTDSMRRFTKFLGEQKWIVGDKITICDFILYEVIDVHRAMMEDFLKHYPTLSDFRDRFEKLPPIRKYIESEKCIKSPFCGPSAQFKG